MSNEFTEEHKKLYQYAGNSNLVLPSDRSKVARRGDRGKEIESLWNKIDPREMGASVRHEAPIKPTQTDEQAERAYQRKQARRAQQQAKLNYGYTDILAASEDLGGIYRPQTQETRQMWELMLSQIREYLGDQAPEVMLSAADEALGVFKNDELREAAKKQQIEQLFGAKVDDAVFSRLGQMAQQITDYNADAGETDGAKMDVDEGDENGIAVMFGGSDEEEQMLGGDEGPVGEVDDEESSEDDSQVGPPLPSQMEAGSESDSTEGDDAAGGYRTVIHGYNEKNAKALNRRNEERAKAALKAAQSTTTSFKEKPTDSGAEKPTKDATKLSARSIDAFWLQRQVGRHYTDPAEVQDKTREALRLLSSRKLAVGELENELAELFEYEHFETVQVLVSNRDLIVWGMRIARAESEGDQEQQQQVEMEMKELGLQWIIAARNGEEPAAVQPSEGAAPKAEESQAAPSKADEYVPEEELDLAELAFAEGGRLMTNEKWVPPKGAVKTVMAGYEEIRVPAPERLPPPGASDGLVELSKLPEWTHAAFKNVTELNRVQSQVFPTAFNTDDNMLICAPTGAGKTNCAALTMLRTIGEYRDAETGRIDTDAFKIVYVAPMKALVAEMAQSFAQRLEPLGLQVAELTGDSQLTKQQLSSTQLIVTTPEKWDVVTRRGGEAHYTALVRLVIIDEIHLLHDDRGPVLEALVSRQLQMQEREQRHVRLVGLSATLPNYEDVATFLRVRRDAVFYFDARYRPCPLQLAVVGVTEKKPLRRLERMDEICYAKTKQYAQNSQVLVFVHSRKETLNTARRLRDMAVADGMAFVRAGSASSEVLRDEAEATRDSGLSEVLSFGIGVHHAGMGRAERQVVEDLFADGHVRVLVSTATLAWGVNLPAHAVVIKGTQVYNPERGRWTELSAQDMLQMLGRAGRPQFDTHGEGIVITAHSELRYYLSLLSQQLPIESQLVSRLPDILNAEIALGTVRSRADAVKWMASTYLYVRMARSPRIYSIDAAEIAADPALRRRRAALAHTALSVLERSALVQYDKRSGRVRATELGRVAAQYYVSHASMAAYQQSLRADAGDIELLRAFAQSSEFRLMPVRADERVELARLAERVPVPVRERDALAKVAVLLQAHVARLHLRGFALAADMAHVTQSAARIFRALFALCIGRGWARAAQRALVWCKQVERRMWAAMSPLRQLECPPDLLRAVERKPLAWARYLDLAEPELAELVGSPRAGRVLYRLVHIVPRVDVTAAVLPLTRSLLRVELRLTPDFAWTDAAHGAAELFWVSVEDGDGDRLLHVEPFVLKRAFATAEHITEFTCALADPLPPQLFVNVVSDRWMGAETRLAVSLRRLQLPARALPPTSLLDMQPLQVSELREPEFEHAYLQPGSPLQEGTFNAVQTQAFHALYATDDSALVAAAPGSGKTIVAELALLRFFRNEAQRAYAEGESYERHRAVYIAPFSTLVHLRACDWQRRLGHLQGGKRFVELTGDAADLRRAEDAHVLLATPTAWDALSRRWRQRQRRAVRSVSLVIADELHWVGGAGLGVSLADDDAAGTDVGGDQLAAAYEVVVSRMRLMAAQLDQPLRIVALSVPLANARDVAAWIGAPSSAVFNFHPAVRPVPLEIQIQTSTTTHFASRMDSWLPPTYRAICGDDVDSVATPPSAIVFVAGRRQCRDVAAGLLTRAAADDAPSRFLHADAVAVEQAAVRCSDRVLREFLEFGVGFFHEAQSPADRQLVLDLFSSGSIRVLVATRQSCYSLDSVHAHTVVIMGAERFCGREHRYVDYAMPDVLQMIGRASRPNIDSQARCVLMCMANKRELYKKFLYEPLPIESRLDAQLHDALNSEVAAKSIENKQDAVDYLTWTLLYRRLSLNPNYYGLQGTTHEHLSSYLSELIESTLSDLAAAKCLTIDEDNETDVASTNLGMIAAFYQVRYLTVEMFALSLSAKTKLRGVLDIISAADEFESLPIRHRESSLLARVANRLLVPLPSSSSEDNEETRWNSPRVRTHLLLQAHFSRLSLPADLAADQQWVLFRVLPLLQAMVDVASSMGWMQPALAAMELSQMTVQAMWEGRDSLIKQVPHMNELIPSCKERGIESVFDIMDMEDEDRTELLRPLSSKQVADIAAFVNRYPNIEVEHEYSKQASAGSAIQVQLSLDREWDEDDEDVPGPAIAPFFPYTHSEGWWVVVGDEQLQNLMLVKRINLRKELQTVVEFAAPDSPGPCTLKLFLMCDAYLGCDQEFDLQVEVLPASSSDEEDDEMDQD
ncbi:Pre-mRNA splicing [Coemansia sp. RSA 990]|nr:Pre-mRNA splicing [Coemansia sp. RSA 1821]KAJ1872683.1 Pre-mRNA splicing [Coemansia sp. RSA 990]